MWPTRRSIIDGKGSPSSSAGNFPPFLLLLPAALEEDEAPSAGRPFFSFRRLSMRLDSDPSDTALAGTTSSSTTGVLGSPSFFLEVDTVSSSTTGALGFPSFFLEDSVFLSALGGFSRSKDTTSNEAPRENAEFRTAGADWI